MRPLPKCAAVARKALGGAAVVLLGSAALAHDFWVQPTTWAPTAGKTICFELRVGDAFEGEALPRDDAYIERFVARTPSGGEPVEVRALPGRPHPAGWLRPEVDGSYAIGFQSKPRFLELAPQKFRAYLLEEMLTDIVNQRSAAGEESEPGREEFVRCAKSLVDVGADTALKDSALGLALEFIALEDPAASASDPKKAKSWRVKLVQDGKPVAGAHVRCRAKDAAKNGIEPQSTVTDKDGVARFELKPDHTWLVTSVQMKRAKGGASSSDPAAKGLRLDWTSYWASLTFGS